MHQSTPSLAGRVSYRELSGISVHEIASEGKADGAQDVETLWRRGGYPESLLAPSEGVSFSVRTNLHRALFERDIPQIAGNLNGVALRRLLAMLAHSHGHEVNRDKLARALDISATTIKRYLDVFEDLMIVRALRPWFQNAKKRYVKRLRIYFRDSGLLHLAHGLRDADAVWGHPGLGKSWEGFVVEQLCQHLPFGVEPYFYRVGDNEVDLVAEDPGKHRLAIEIKRGDAPRLRPGFHRACADLQPTARILVHGGQGSFPLDGEVMAHSLTDAVAHMRALYPPDAADPSF